MRPAKTDPDVRRSRLIGLLGMEALTMFGLNIVPHPLAREVRDEWKVEPHPIKKRRRNWRVVKHHIDRPGAYQIGNTIYMHPDLVAKLKEATPNA